MLTFSSRSRGPAKKSSVDTANQETDESLVASTELASELKMAFNQYAKVGRLQILV